MKIRAGYDITYECPQPTPMLLALSVHPSRMPDVIGPHPISFDPPIGASEYRDGFGNICHRIVAPAGRLRISTQFLVSDPGTRDAVVPNARQHAIQDLPEDTLVYLLGSRYCETDRLTQAAWSLFENTPPGWAGTFADESTQTPWTMESMTPADGAPLGQALADAHMDFLKARKAIHGL